MATALHYTVFHKVLFPDIKEVPATRKFSLRRTYRFDPHPASLLQTIPIVVFDLETTGLDSDIDRIIEIGAIKTLNGETLAEFSSLVKASFAISSTITRLTGITQEMLVDQPQIEAVMPEFLKFIEGSILVAHNAPFDSGFLKKECSRLNIDIDWATFCTLKMARELLPNLESRSLDALAAHFHLSFEARHRSIGDVRVTSEVLKQFLQQEQRRFTSVQCLKPFGV